MTSLGFRVGMKEYFCPHLLQKPFSRRRGLLQLPQKRLFSGTVGLTRINFSGSVDGSSGIETRPAPNCLRLLRVEVELVRREPRDRLVNGDDPVPVIDALRPVGVVVCFWLVVCDLTAAKPQTLQ